MTSRERVAAFCADVEGRHDAPARDMALGVQLNPPQERAVAHRDGPLLVLAGAGTGKTRVITQRILTLMEEGVRPWEILAVTFTNKAAAQMRARIEAGLDAGQGAPVQVRDLWIGTFHSICARILRRFGEGVGLSSNFSIYDAADQKTLMGRVCKALEIKDPSLTPKSILGYIEKAKQRGVTGVDAAALNLDDPQRSTVVRAWGQYRAHLQSADAVDFGDLLVRTLELLNQKPAEGSLLGDLDPLQRFRERFRHVVVDEFQDTNPVQSMLVEALSKKAQLCVVGDDDQSIYGWRGADISQFLGFASRHPGCEVIRLEQNYRSTQHILECADAVIRKNQGRMGKKLWSDLGEGERVQIVLVEDERQEAQLVARALLSALDQGAEPESCAVFYRTHAQSRVLEEALRRAQISYRMVGGTRFFDRAEIKDLIAYLRLLVTPSSDLDVARIINRPARGIGATSLARLTQYATDSGCTLLQACTRPQEAGLGTAAAKKVSGFVALIAGLSEGLSSESLSCIAGRVLDQTGYREYLLAQDDVESQSRLENLQEFLGSLDDFEREHEGEVSLALYLEQAALASTEENPSQAHSVNMMTIHSAKGLEFDHVFLTGMEERVFPHARSMDDPEQMEEERRLAYVAVTRAKRHLCISHARRRFLYGQTQVGQPSRFVVELPDAHVQRSPGSRGRAAAPSRPREAAPAPREEYYDQSESSAVFVGMPVRHQKYGRGEVMGWDGSGEQMKLTIRFRQAGSKTILARFCEPA